MLELEMEFHGMVSVLVIPVIFTAVLIHSHCCFDCCLQADHPLPQSRNHGVHTYRPIPSHAVFLCDSQLVGLD